MKKGRKGMGKFLMGGFLALIALILCIPFQSWSFRAPDIGGGTDKSGEKSVLAEPPGKGAEGIMNLNLKSVNLDDFSGDNINDTMGFKTGLSGDAIQTAKEVAGGIFNGKKQDAQDGKSLTGSISNVKATVLESEAQLKKVQKDALGYTHVRLTQTFQGLPVVGAEIVVHYNDRGDIYQANGKYLPTGDLASMSLTPHIGKEAALKIGLSDQTGKPGMAVKKAPELVIYNGRLAYHYVISHDAGEGIAPGQWWYC